VFAAGDHALVEKKIRRGRRMTHPGNGRIVFTPERCAALAEDWQAGVDASAIMERLNTMPGMPVRNHKLVQQKASQMGLKRPEGWLLRRKSAPKHNVWTVDRLELLRNLINLVPDADVLERVNALPGPALKNLESMRRRAQRMGYLAERPRKSGPNQGTWTELRTSFLRENYGRIPPAELLVALQAMPGPAIGSMKTARSAAVRLGIKSAGLVRTPPAPRASRAAGSVGARPAAGPPQGGPAPSGGSEPREAGSVGALFIATNHWSVSMGSMTWPVRAQMGSMSLWGLTSSSRPSFSRSASKALRASKRSMPW
jgi:hypothetical protein